MPKYVLDPDDLADYIDAESSRLLERSRELLLEAEALGAVQERWRKVLEGTAPHDLPPDLFYRK